MTHHFFKPLLIAAAIGLTGTLAVASQSEGSGTAETGDAQAYNVGKMVYFQKLACQGCALAGKSLDAATARDILSGKVKVELSQSEKSALGVYLSRRFRL